MFIIDILSSLFKKLWFKGKIITRVNFKNHYMFFAYPTTFIKRHKSAPGVSEVLKKLKKAHNSFERRRSELLERESAIEQSKYKIWKVFHLIKVISKRSFFVGIFLSFAIMIMYSKSVALEGLFAIAIILEIILIPLSVFSKIAEKIAGISYEKYSCRINNELKNIKLEYCRKEKVYGDEMDELCLESLSELERSEELHHREIIAIQKKNAETMANEIKQIKKENSKHNNAVERDLRKFKIRMGIED